MVPPTLELEAVLTRTLDPEAFWEDAAWLAAVEVALVVLVLLFELLPHAARRMVAARAGVSSFSEWRIVGLRWDECFY
jgi:hypothetical protein